MRELARQYVLSCGIGVLVMLFLTVQFIIGVNAGSPWVGVIDAVVSPGYWVADKTFPPGPDGYRNIAADISATAVMYLIDAMLWGVVILIGWRTATGLQAERDR